MSYGFQKSTRRIVIIVIAILATLYIASLGLSYSRMRNTSYGPLSPSKLTVIGFVKAEANARSWKVLFQNDVPQVVEMEDDKFAPPQHGREGSKKRRVDIQEIYDAKVFPVILTEAHVTKAWVKKSEPLTDPLRRSPYVYAVPLRLSEEGRARFWQYAHEHVGEQMLVIVDGQLWAAPVIKPEVANQGWLLSRFSPFESSDLQIQPIWDEEVATTIADAIKK